MSDKAARITVEASAPQWAHALARDIEREMNRLWKAQRDLEARVKTLEGP